MQLTYGGAAIGQPNAARFGWGKSLLRNKAGIGYGFRYRVQCPEITLAVAGNAYGLKPQSVALTPDGKAERRWALSASRGWYDLSVRLDGEPGYFRRLAGRVETGRPSISDPAMAGPAIMDQLRSGFDAGHLQAPPVQGWPIGAATEAYGEVGKGGSSTKHVLLPAQA